MVYRYLMVFEEGQVTVAEYSASTREKIRYVTNQGERAFPVSEDFWTWWKNAVSYLEGEPVDFCFLYDRDYKVLHHGLVMSSDTCWNEKIVESFVNEMMDCPQVILTLDDGRRRTITKRRTVFSERQDKKFFTNVSFDWKEDVGCVKETKVSPLARFCREKLVERGKSF